MSEKGTYSDPRCCTCNPPGWREVDGVQLPEITWAEPVTATVNEIYPGANAVKAVLDRNSAKWDALFAAEEAGPKPYHSGRQDVLRKGRAE